MITINRISVVIKGNTILNNVSCELKAGKIVGFIGKSGVGKTTFLKTIVGLQSPTSGSVTLSDGQGLAAINKQSSRRFVGYVFQDFNLFPHLTVLQNCIDPLLIRGLSKDDARIRAMQFLHQLGLADVVNQFPQTLSGGQKQRVAIARALCLQPELLLLDEPTASLDPINTAILVELLKSLARDGLAVGFSSQDMEFVKACADEICFFENGTIVEQCTHGMESCSCQRISQFLGTNII